MKPTDDSSDLTRSTPKPEALPLTGEAITNGAESGAGSYSEAHKLAEQDLREQITKWFRNEAGAINQYDTELQRQIYDAAFIMVTEAVLHFQGFDKGGGE